MKILIDATCISNQTTGIGRYAYELIKALLRIDAKNKYTIVVNSRLSKKHQVFRLNTDNHKLIQLPFKGTGIKRQFFFVSPSLHEGYDIFHCLHFDVPLYNPYTTITTVHDLKYIIFPEFFVKLPKLKVLYQKWKLRSTLSKGAVLIAVSESTKRDLVKYFNADPTKIVVIYEGVSDFPDMTFESLKSEDNLLKSPYIFFLGEKRPHKNIEGLLNAFIIFKEKYDKWDTRLIVAGKCYKDYRVQVPEKLKEVVHFVGFVPENKISTYYLNARLFVFPSFYEGFGLPVLESMKCGTPVIVSNTSSLPEVAGDAALLVDPMNHAEIAEAIYTLISNPSLAREFVEKGYNRVKKFSWEKAARETLSLYESHASIAS